MGIAVFPAAGGGVTPKVTEFTSTGNFTVPATTTALEVFLVGGGGGGGGASTRRGSNFNMAAAGGGGGGGAVIRRWITVTPGQTYTVTIGAGGSAGTNGTTNATKGGDTSFGSLATAVGGGAGGGGSNNDQGSDVYSTANMSGGCAGGLPRLQFNGTSNMGNAGGSAGSSAAAMTGGNTNGVTFLDSGVFSSQGGSPAATLGGSAPSGYAPGIGIDGFGGGGAPGVCSQGTVPNYFILPNSGGGRGSSSPEATTQANNGSAGTANTGGGGGGGAVSSNTANGVTYTQAGTNGGSGYARVIYWS